MRWYYAEQGKQMGPVDELGLDQLASAGIVRSDTLVWNSGMAGWQEYGSVRGAAGPVANGAAVMPGVALGDEVRYCSECRRPFAVHDLVAIGPGLLCAGCKPLFLQRAREGGQGLKAAHYAGFWIRLVARLIDGVLLAIVEFIIRLPLLLMLPGVLNRTDPTSGMPAAMGIFGAMMLINLAIGISYEVYFVSTRGATIGKIVLGLKIVRADGSPLNTQLSFGRYFAQWVSGFTLMVGYIMAAFDDEKRALHDRICETRVIYAK